MPTKSFIADAKSRNAITILVWLSFVRMASSALAQGPLPIPSGPSAVLPLGLPARITSIRGRASTDTAPGGTSCSIARCPFQTSCSISGCLFRTSAGSWKSSTSDKDWPRLLQCPTDPS
jgi:hypothetical protein